MFRNLILSMLLIVTVGCGQVVPPEAPPPQKPPLYNRGDVVRVVNGPVVGIITAAYQKERQWKSDPFAWKYYVMWRDENIMHDEDQLELVEKFNWDRPVTIIKAEVTEPFSIETEPKTQP